MVTNILTGVLVIVTTFYAFITYKILRANEKVVEVMHEQAEAMTRPYIYISLFCVPDSFLFYLRISNTGKTAARKLRLTIDKPFHKFGSSSQEENLTTLPAFNQVIDSFSPGAEFIFSLATSFQVLSEDADENILPKKFTITAEYSYDNKTVKEDTIIDLTPHYKSTLPPDAYIRKLKEIQQSIQKIADAVKQK